MGAAVGLRDDFGAEELRRLAVLAKDADQARRLLALAAVCAGMRREEAARLGGMDRQTLRDWVHRFNEQGVDGLINVKPTGRRPRLSLAQLEDLRQLVEAGPDPHKDGVVRWRCVDLKRVLSKRHGVDLSEVRLGRILKDLGFSHISARPRHPAQDPEAIAAFKKSSPIT
jgi:transposase